MLRAQRPAGFRREYGFGKPGRISFHTRRISWHVSRPSLDDPPVFGLRHRSRIQPSLPLSPLSGKPGPFRGAFDLPTQLGLDSDHPLAEGEVGRAGVAIDGLWDMETLFHEIDLSRVSTSMTINSTAPILLAALSGSGPPAGNVLGGAAGDGSKTTFSRSTSPAGTYLYPVGGVPSGWVTDLVTFCHESVPGWNPISISGYHIREAGSTAAQEIGFHAGQC